jgi:5-methylcytosine-specific restriction endonuclease McrA
MPFLKPCLGAAGAPCPTRALTDHRSGRCERCRRAHGRHLYATTRSGHNPRRWREFRLTILRRDDYRCYVTDCDRMADEVDHIVPLARGGAEYDEANCRAACQHHNRSRGARPD